jgi:hypothetical protein
LKTSPLSFHEIQNRTANKFLFTQSSELFSFVCSIWHTSVFKFTTVVYWTVSEWCEYIVVSESDWAVFKNICYFQMYLRNSVIFCDKLIILETLFILRFGALRVYLNNFGFNSNFIIFRIHNCY